MSYITQEQRNWITRNYADSAIEEGLKTGELQLLPRVGSVKKDQVGFYLYNNCINAREKNYKGGDPRGRFLGDLVSWDDLYEHYGNWCREKTLIQKSNEEFETDLVAKGYTKNQDAFEKKIGEDNIYWFKKRVTLGEERIGLVLVNLDQYSPVDWFP